MRKLTKKSKKIILSGAILIIFIISVAVTLGRYIIDLTQTHYLESKGFYFNSSTMTTLGSSHSISNWDGVNSYTLTIDVNSKKNDYIKTDENVEYDIEVQCSTNVSCTVNKTQGTIFKTNSTDSYTITITPIGEIGHDETATVRTSVTSTFPYRRTLSTTYEIGIETYSFSHRIVDSRGSKIVELELTNSFPFYVATESFGSFQVGDTVSQDEFALLSDSDKSKCKSAVVTVKIDNSRVRLDMNNNTYLFDKESEVTETIDGAEYVKEFTFKMNATSTKKIILYKLDTTQDYNDDETLIDLVVDMAE